MRPLGEVYAMLFYGRLPREPSQLELAIWTRRLAWQVGSLQISVPPLRVLAGAEGENVREAYDGLRLLLGLRAGMEIAGDPFPYGRCFASAWCQLTEWEARSAIERLVARHVIEQVGTSGRFGKVKLYRALEP